MALALLRASRVPGSRGTAAFTLDLGSNRFYQFAVGDDTVDRSVGFPRLGAPSFTSPVLGPLPESAMGRATLEISDDRFDRDHRSVQVTSYRTRNRDGPALSDIVRVGSVARGHEDLPPISFSLSERMDPYAPYTAEDGYGVEASWRAPVRMPYRDVPAMSGAMFLGALIPVLSGLASKILPKVLPKLGGLLRGAAGATGAGNALNTLLGSLLGGGAPVADGTGGTATATPATLIKPETAQLLMQLLEQLQGKAVAAPATVTATALSVGGSEYSRASVAPLLVAALPALMPLLEKVLTPETIKTVLEHADPTKIIGALTDSLKELGELGLEHDKQENEHLRALNPMGVHAPVDDLLKEMGFAASTDAGVTRERGEPAYRRVESVTLNFAAASPVMIHGRSRVCYRTGDEIAFPLDLETPRPIADAHLTLLVKDPATRKILVRKPFTVHQAGTGRLATRITLTPAETKPLAEGEEYLVCAYLVWKNGRGKRIGTSRSQMITVIGEYIFDRVEEGTVVPLNDMGKFRPFWHKVWQGSFTTEFYKLDFEGKYYYALETSREGNAPIETTVTFEPNGDKVRKGRLRSGMTTSLGALNALLPVISNAASLPADQLGALRSSDFVSRFNVAARFHAPFSGKAGISAALWVYPEVKVQQVVLFKAASTDADGHVRELTETRVPFPMPVTIHVIGARTTR
ncbi:MAG: hypothetical protein ABI910_10610 [Gemmatimonadota bacterium]